MTETAHTPLPCPFCGGEALIGQTLDGAWYAMCVVDHCCKLESYWRTEAEALTAWNTRAVNSHHDLIEALREMVEVAHGYAEYISSVPSAELERHPYLPGLEDQINEARAILTKAEAGHG